MELVKGKLPENAQQMIAAGNFPDMILSGIATIGLFHDMGLTYDLNDFVKKYNFNISDIGPKIIEETKKYGDQGQLYALP